MGLIKALSGAVGGVLADQWKEFFYCDALSADVLVAKGQKRTSSRSSNTKGEDNIISKGSGIAVNEGQCMIIVESGEVVEFCAEPGNFTYDNSTEPSLFAGSLGASILDTFKNIGRRFTYGGDTGKDQRVYYFNTKEITDNKFGTAAPIPFRVVQASLNLDFDVSVRCNGVYSYRITDPLLFYSNVCGNVSSTFKRSEIDGQLKAEFLDALQPGFGKLSDMQIRPNQIVSHNKEMREAMNEELSREWVKRRGISIVSIAINSVTLPPEDLARIQKAQDAAIYANPMMAGGVQASAGADAAKIAAGNANGAVNGFIGLNMAQNMNQASNMFQAGAAMGFQQPQVIQQQTVQQPNVGNIQPQQQAPAPAPAAPAADTWICPKCGKEATGKFCPECGAKKPEPKPAEGGWTCPQCGKTVTGKFCPECGTKKPEEAPAGWTCPKCGAVNKGKFCSECGEKKPAGARLYKCDKCGWEPEDSAHPPKFCPECGDPFDDSDAIEK